jgi:hypothetical protein
VLSTSAVAPGGLDALRDVLADAVVAHVAALRRVAADLDAVYSGLSGVTGGPARQALDGAAVDELTRALSSAAGVSAVGTAVRQAYRHRASMTMGSPFLRWLRRLRPDPLRRLHLDRRSDAAGPQPDGIAVPARTSVPEPSAVQRSRVDQALRTLADHASEGLPAPWPDTVRDAARSHSADLSDRLDRAVAGTDLGVTKKPAWWRALGAAQALLATAAVAGGLWLAGLYALTVLRLPDPGTPMIGAVPLPTLLLLGGLLVGLVLALLARLLAALLAGRQAARAETRLRAAVAEVADDLVVTPIRTELSAYDALRAALSRLRPSR